MESNIFPNKKVLFGALSLVILLITIDQCIKVYIKTHFYLYETVPVFGNWFKLYFIENNGAAFGLEIGGVIGKYILTAFRLIVTCLGFYYLVKIIKKGASKLLVVCLSLILAGAIGNIIDSVFYGYIFKSTNEYLGSWFQGRVVDMFYAPMFTLKFPASFPNWLGDSFTFFSPIWNFADACISVGIFLCILFQRRVFKNIADLEKPNPVINE